jgi:transposase
VDETGMSCHPNVQRSWSPRGQAHCADASISNRRVNVLGALDWQSKQLSYQLHEGSTRRSDFTQFLDTLARNSDPDKWTIAVMDNASIHHGLDQQSTDEWLVQKFVPLYLPTYSPELNPIEILWKQAKYHWRSFKTWARDQLLSEVKALLDGYGTKFHVSFA